MPLTTRGGRSLSAVVEDAHHHDTAAGATAAMPSEFVVMIEETKEPCPTNVVRERQGIEHQRIGRGVGERRASAMSMRPLRSTCAVSTPVSRMKTLSPDPCDEICQALSAWIWVMFHCSERAGAFRGLPRATTRARPCASPAHVSPQCLTVN